MTKLVTATKKRKETDPLTVAQRRRDSAKARLKEARKAGRLKDKATEAIEKVLPETVVVLTDERAVTCKELKMLQQKRTMTLKVITMNSNYLRAAVARTLGYVVTMTAAEREAKFKEADEVIAAVEAKKRDHELKDLIEVVRSGVFRLEVN